MTKIAKATTVTTTPPMSTPPLGTLRLIPLTDLRPSPWNPRQHIEPRDLDTLSASLRDNGQFTALIVRPVATKGKSDGGPTPGHYEIGAGHRRFRAATMAGLTALLCEVRDLTDEQFELLLALENLDRADLHPLDEAQHYAAMMKRSGVEPTVLAAALHKPLTHIYDRLRLLRLIPAARLCFESGEITLAHAILLSRLTASQQTVAMQDGLFRPVAAQQVLLEGITDTGLRAVTTPRELAAWIRTHTRFDEVTEIATALFPETAAAVANAKEVKQKVIHITFEGFVRPDARDEKERTYGPRSFKVVGDKPCPHAAIGVVVVGERQGEAFPVCIARDKCKVHFGTELAAKAKGEKQALAKGGETADAKWKREAALREAEQQKQQAVRQRFQAAAPRIAVALKAQMDKATSAPGGPLTAIILGHVFGRHTKNPAFAQGKTAETFVRALAFLLAVERLRGYDAPEAAQALCRTFKVDLKKVLDASTPKAAKPAAHKK